MSERWLVLDVPNLAWRAFHALPELTHHNKPTGVLFGVLRDIAFLGQRFDTHRFAFAFEGKGQRLRNKVSATYKNNRNVSRTDAEIEARKTAQEQIDQLCSTVLPAIGFGNILSERGYEADDMIASLIQHHFQQVVWTDYDNQGKYEFTIVSSDHDLYQLLGGWVELFHPQLKELVTLQSFYKRYGIHPKRWAEVKAIAGCSSDNVHGVPRVGESTAIKYLKNELPAHHRTHEAIDSMKALWQGNLPLVKLPYRGCPPQHLKDCAPSPKKWDRLCRELDAESLVGMCPGAGRMVK